MTIMTLTMLVGFKYIDFERIRIRSSYDITSKNVDRSQLPALGLTTLPQQVLSEIQRADGVMAGRNAIEKYMRKRSGILCMKRFALSKKTLYSNLSALA